MASAWTRLGTGQTPKTSPWRLFSRLRSLPAPAPTAAQTAEENQDRTCAICLEEITTCGEVDKCAHRFCLACLLQWSDHSNTCPVCRQEFVQVFQSTKFCGKPQYWRYPVRCVFQMRDFRDYVAECLPLLQTLDYSLKFNRSTLVMLK